MFVDASMAWDQILQTSLQTLSARQTQVLVTMEEMNEVREHLRVLVHDIKRYSISKSLPILTES
jgi:hypothetical protein